MTKKVTKRKRKPISKIHGYIKQVGRGKRTVEDLNSVTNRKYRVTIEGMGGEDPPDLSLSPNINTKSHAQLISNKGFSEEYRWVADRICSGFRNPYQIKVKIDDKFIDLTNNLRFIVTHTVKAGNYILIFKQSDLDSWHHQWQIAVFDKATAELRDAIKTWPDKLELRFKWVLDLAREVFPEEYIEFNLKEFDLGSQFGIGIRNNRNNRRSGVRLTNIVNDEIVMLSIKEVEVELKRRRTFIFPIDDAIFIDGVLI